MASHRAGLVLWLCAAGAACGTAGGARQPAGEPGEEVRTANPAARGLTDADFPRVKRLADCVYTYEQLRSAGDQRFTTLSLFLTKDEGVLVADGQGSVAATERL